MSDNPHEAADMRLVTGALKHLAASPNHPMRDMARNVLSGRVSVEAAADDPKIADQFLNAAQKFREWQRSISPEQLAQIGENMSRNMENMQDALTREQDR
jgi:hypothetical protein